MEDSMLVRVELVSEYTKFTWRSNHLFRKQELYDFVNTIKETFFEKDSPVRISIDISETINEER